MTEPTTPNTSTTPTTTPPIPSPLRQCGRCRQFFPASADLHPAELKEWWSCDACSAQIIPSHQRPPTDR